MDINKFASAHCDFCNYETNKTCLSCKKIMVYEALKEGFKESFLTCDLEKAIRDGVVESFPPMSYIEKALKNGVIEGLPSRI